MSPQKIAYTALFLALGILLPWGFHQFGIAGRIFLPMHIPVLLCGFMMGALPALIVGIGAPVLSHLMTGMPPAYAVPLMALELPLYGLSAALFYRKWRWNIYLALVVSMIAGRLGFALGLFLLGLFIQMPYGPAQLFATGGAFVSGLPGTLLQIFIIPPLVAAANRRKSR